MGSLFAGVGVKLLELVLPTLATALAGLGVAFLSKKLQSAGLTLTAQQQDQLTTLATKAVLAVEEQAHRNGSMSGAEKDAAAIAIVQSKLPAAHPDDVRIAVDAALPSIRSSKAIALQPSTPGTFGR